MISTIQNYKISYTCPKNAMLKMKWNYIENFPYRWRKHTWCKGDVVLQKNTENSIEAKGHKTVEMRKEGLENLMLVRHGGGQRETAKPTKRAGV